MAESYESNKQEKKNLLKDNPIAKRAATKTKTKTKVKAKVKAKGMTTEAKKKKTGAKKQTPFDRDAAKKKVAKKRAATGGTAKGKTATGKASRKALGNKAGKDPKTKPKTKATASAESIARLDAAHARSQAYFANKRKNKQK